MLSAETRLYRFGPFTVDPARRALTCNGEPVALQSRTFDLLVCLVQRAGRVVTKDELVNELWPDAFIEDSNLSQHIFLLRKALARCAPGEHPIATLAGRGYQFVAKVEREPSALAHVPASVAEATVLTSIATSTTVVVEESSSDETHAVDTPLLPAPSRSRLAARITLTAALAAAVGYAADGWMHRAPTPVRRVVIADFQNQTGDAVFNRSLDSALRVSMEQSPWINVLGRKAIGETLRSMQKPPETALAGETAREVCQRSNDEVLLNGTIGRVGSRLLLTLEASDCRSGESVAAEETQVADASSVLPALDGLTRSLRRRLGESRRQVAAYEIPVAQATTNSLEALQAYSQAMVSLDRGDTVSQQALLQHAVTLDPGFASAYKELAEYFYHRSDFVQARASMQKSYDLRGNTTERERLTIEIAYNRIDIFDWEAAIASMKLFGQIYPEDAENWYQLGLTYASLGLYTDAVQAAERGYALDPHSGTGAEALARIYRGANRFDDARRVALNAIAQGKDLAGLHRVLYAVAFVRGDQASMSDETAWGLAHHEPGEALIDEGFAAASQGKLREARVDFHRARQIGLDGGDPDFADDASMFLAGILAEYGDPAGAAAALREIGNVNEDPPTIAYFWSLLGDNRPAEKCLEQLTSARPMGSLTRYFDIPELTAYLALSRHRAAEALADLEPARKY
jgi:DNA-binding winged helix-turn-helix (wHTH) protein/tetratricopeptide (TPR) repeat protein